jgi:hypothetical protein
MSPEEGRLILAGSVSGIVGGANTIIISLYLLKLGLDPFEVGLLLSGGVIVSSSISFALSLLGDAYGRRPFAVGGRAISACGLLLLASGVPAGYLFSSSWGAGSLLNSLLMEKSRSIERSLSVQSALSILFSVVGSLVPALLGYRPILFLDVAVVLASGLLVFGVREEYRGQGGINLRLRSLRLLSKLSTEALIGLGAGLVIPLMSLWFYLRFSVSAEEMSPVFVASNLTLALATLSSSRMAAALGRVKTIVVTHAGAVILLAILPFSFSFPLASVIFVSRNALMNMSGPLFSSMILRLLPPNERSRGNALINLMESVPRAVGPSVGGYLFNSGNLSLPFLITSVLYTLSTAGFYILFRKSTV